MDGFCDSLGTGHIPARTQGWTDADPNEMGPCIKMVKPHSRVHVAHVYAYLVVLVRTREMNSDHSKDQHQGRTGDTLTAHTGHGHRTEEPSDLTA